MNIAELRYDANAKVIDEEEEVGIAEEEKDA